MAAGGIGALVVSLGLDAAEFITGMTKSEQQAKKFADTLDRNIAAGIIKAQLALEALGRGAQLAVETFKELTTGAGEFQDLAEKTGASAQDLASLAVAAKVAGVGIGDVADATTKLTKNLVGVDDESKAAGAALKAIGLNVKEFKALDPVAQYTAVGKALEGFADGAGKVAVAQALFGKSGADQLRVLKELEAEGGASVILTQRQIQLADDYADKQAKAREQLKLYAQAAATEAIPALTDLTAGVIDVVKALLGAGDAAKQLSANDAIRTFAEDATLAVAGLGDALIGIVKTASAVGGSFQAVGADIALPFKVAAAAAGSEGGSLADRIIGIKKALDDRNKTVADANQRYVDLWTQDAARIRHAVEAARDARKTNDAQKAIEDRGFNPTPKLAFNGVDENAAAALKKGLDAQLAVIRDFLAEQNAAFDFAQKFVKGTYDDGLVSLRDYYEAQREIRAAGLQAQLDALDKEIAAQRSFAAKTLKPEERLDAENKIADAVRKRALAVEKAQQEGTLSAQEEARSILALQDRYDDLRATILRLSGDTAGAARISIAKQVEDARKLITQQGGDQGQADNLGALLTNTQALTQAQQDYSRLLERSRNAEEAIQLAAVEGGQSELDTLRAVADARADSLATLRRLTDQANELALALGTPEAIDFAERLGLALKKATAEVDPLLQKIRDVGAEAGKSIASEFEDAVVQGKTLRDTIKGIDQDLTRLLLRNLVTNPLGNTLTNLIGGNGQASGGGGLIGLAGSFLSGLFGGGGSGGVSGGAYLGAGGLLGGGRAIGGPVDAGGIYRVAESRPEVLDVNGRSFLLMGNQRGSIDPNPQLGGSRTINAPIYITVPGNTDRRTATQIGAEVSRALAVANARNN